MAAASSIGVWLYDTTFKNTPLLLGKYEYGNKLAYSGDGQLIAALGRNKTIAIWDTGTNEQVSSIHYTTDYLSCFALHPEGTWVVVCGWDQVVSCWNTKTGLQDKTLSFDKPVCSLAFSPDGRYLAVGCNDATVRLWDLSSDQIITLPDGLFPHNQVQDDVQIVFGANDTLAYGVGGTIVIWDLKTQSEHQQLTCGAQGLESIAFSPDGNMLATAHWACEKSGPGHIRLWNLQSGEEQIIASDGGVSVSFSRDGKTLAYTNGGWSGTIYLWNIEEKKSYYFPAHGNIADGLAFTDDSKLLAYGANNGFIRVLDIQSGQEQYRLQKPNYDSGSASNTFTFQPNSAVLAFTDWDKLWLWHLDNNQVEDLELPNKIYLSYSTKTIIFDPDGKNLLIASPKPFICEIGQKLLLQFLPHTNDDLTRDVTISAAGNYIAECGYFKNESVVSTIRLWQLPDFSLLKSFGASSWVPQSIAVSLDGKKIATAGSRDSGGRMTAIGALYDVDTGQERFSFTGQTYYGSQMKQTIFNPSGDLIAFSDTSGTIFLWNAASEAQIKVLQAHSYSSGVWSMAFSPDGRLLVTIGSDSTLRIWGIVESQ